MTLPTVMCGRIARLIPKRSWCQRSSVESALSPLPQSLCRMSQVGCGTEKEIEGELLAAAEATNIKRIPSYHPIPEGRIIEAIDRIGNALSHLSIGDSAKLMTPDGEAKF